MLKENNSGFINFPVADKSITDLNIGKTLVYLISFDVENFNKEYILSNLKLPKIGYFVSDDMQGRHRIITKGISIDDLIISKIKDEESDRLYFPSDDDANDKMSMPLITCICIGWHEKTFEFKNDSGFWFANFENLTNEGKKLYYSIKKLHNNKEVRILTFNGI
jgi:hypothetical protein